mmetsp:Transcript_25327/g.82421  ORF Transcript_25327/g.82421 Transcript_25327/m.82421 type:complete len:294 (-) Transcript_25327:3166-4047(-)
MRELEAGRCALASPRRAPHEQPSAKVEDGRDLGARSHPRARRACAAARTHSAAEGAGLRQLKRGGTLERSVGHEGRRSGPLVQAFGRRVDTRLGEGRQLAEQEALRERGHPLRAVRRREAVLAQPAGCDRARGEEEPVEQIHRMAAGAPRDVVKASEGGRRKRRVEHELGGDPVAALHQQAAQVLEQVLRRRQPHLSVALEAQSAVEPLRRPGVRHKARKRAPAAVGERPPRPPLMRKLLPRDAPDTSGQGEVVVRRAAAAKRRLLGQRPRLALRVGKGLRRTVVHCEQVESC